MFFSFTRNGRHRVFMALNLFGYEAHWLSIAMIGAIIGWILYGGEHVRAAKPFRIVPNRRLFLALFY